MRHCPASHRDRLRAVELEFLRLLPLPGQKVCQRHAGAKDGTHLSPSIGDRIAGVLAQNATLSPPFSSRISRASSDVAISSPSPSMIWRAFVTCAALLSASLPAPIQRLSSRPTRTLPPIAAAIAAIGSWLRPAPSTDQ